MKPRDYQVKAHTCIHHEWETAVATAAVMPTGTGKTVLFACVIKSRLPGRALVLAHREELIWQARDKIERFAGVDCGIEMAELYVNASLWGEQKVVISTIQTMISKWGDRFRMGRFKPTDFDTLIIDECHHSTADSYRRVIDYYRQNPKLKVLGVTATPDRADEEALGQVFDTVAFNYEILDAIQDGWLVPIEQQFVSIGDLDFSDIRTTAGDLNGADLAKLMESEKNMQGVTGASLQIIGARRAILFTCSVKQAEQAAEIFNRHRPGMADWVCGATNKDDRRQKLEDFRSGKIQVMCNCLDDQTEILTKRGWIGIDGMMPFDETATLRMGSNLIEWQPISRIVKRLRQPGERMVEIRNQTLNMRVTEGHRMLVGCDEHHIKVCNAGELPSRKSPYIIPLSGVDVSVVGVPLTPAELEFLGLYASDGSLNVKRASIEIVQSKEYRENCESIERILNECGFDWKRTGNGRYWRYRIPKGNIGGTLARRGWCQLSGWIDKSLSTNLSAMTPTQFESLIYGLWLGDGDKHYHRSGRRANPGYRICGVNWTMFDRLQAWAVVRGWASNFRIRANTSCGKHPNSVLGHISLRKRSSVRTNNSSVKSSGGNPASFGKLESEEWVWCVTNENGTIITRRNGYVAIMGQCGVLTEGFDDPGVEVIIMGRPTKSRSLYAQMAGRGTRPADGLVDKFELPNDRVQAILHSPKPACLIVDFVGNSGRHKLMSAADILGGKVSDEAVARAVDKAKKDGGAVRMDAVLSEEEERLRQEIEKSKQAAERRRVRLVAKVQFQKRTINPFDAFDIQPVKQRGWDSQRVLSEKQSQMLMRQGINPDTLSYTEGRQIVSELFRRFDKKLCTLKQAALLKRFGYDTKDLNMADATNLITQLKGSNWRRPSRLAAAQPATSQPLDSYADEQVGGREENIPF
jgi:superfamily II DNA or RNA helicase